jgi:hypothetical protein
VATTLERVFARHEKVLFRLMDKARLNGRLAKEFKGLDEETEYLENQDAIIASILDMLEALADEVDEQTIASTEAMNVIAADFARRERGRPRLYNLVTPKEQGHGTEEGRDRLD